ncbi:RNA 2',3'-cyclic phosphodiesterase [Pseudomonas sp. FME51]|uniref:RNA 2',3'-cyclic phosphodiesterase n=1 Tax=Pseudomonas sp. FME51 TaxID=2742609 RepID=UPI001866CACC|nr:RNA 2',3'-cyclic phosphodiesterase [Pseudomonas sp. FME51]
MLRLFVGIELPESVRGGLAAVREDYPSAHWHEPEHLHLTLNFIGSVDEECAGRMATALVDVPGPAFSLTVQGVGYFGTPERPSVLWAGLAPSLQLHQLQQALEARLLPLGLMVEDRPYAPHITLARVKPGVPLQAFLQRHAQLSMPAFPVEHISLFLSSRGEHGVRYRVIERFRLA